MAPRGVPGTPSGGTGDPLGGPGDLRWGHTRGGGMVSSLFLRSDPGGGTPDLFGSGRRLEKVFRPVSPFLVYITSAMDRVLYKCFCGVALPNDAHAIREHDQALYCFIGNPEDESHS